jgi:hypothetical protein
VGKCAAHPRDLALNPDSSLDEIVGTLARWMKEP